MEKKKKKKCAKATLVVTKSLTKTQQSAHVEQAVLSCSVVRDSYSNVRDFEHTKFENDLS